jgi:sulfur transfer complex TusBCD TusB component (DsrH family)
MSGRRAGALLVVAALIGYAGFALLFWRIDRLARTGVAIDSATAIRLARDAAARFGVDERGASGSVVPRLDDSAIRQTHGRDPSKLPPEQSGLMARVRLRGAAATVIAEIDSRGRLIGIDVAQKAPVAPVSDEAARALGSRWLATLAGSDAAAYELAERSTSKGAVHLVWTRRGDPERRAEAFVHDAAQPRVRLFSFMPKDRSPRHIVDVVTAFAWGATKFLLALGAIIAGAVAIARGTARFRWAFAAAIPFAIFFAADFLLSPRPIVSPWEELPVGREAAETIGIVFSAAVIPLFRLLICGLAWAAGRVALVRQEPAATHAVDALLAGRISERNTGRAVLAGIASAGLVASIPLLVAAASAGRVDATVSRGDLLFSPAPFLLLLAGSVWSALWDGLPLFGLVVPLADTKSRRLSNALAIALGAAWLGARTMYGPGEDIAALLSGAVVSALLLLVYRRLGLTAVLASLFAADVLRGVATLWVRPALGTHLAAAGGVAILLALAVFAWVVVKRGKEETVAPATTSTWTAATPASTDRLRAEMELARSMQERLMGKELESVPGFEISSVCRPAKDVGGDLYTVVPVRGDRYALALAVADVAGKGLPAALMMTLTKGLLLGAVEESADAMEIVSILNEGIRASGDRKTFVTALIAVLDPERRRCTIVRAGHTPAMLVRAGGGAVEHLRPDGIALGLSADATFRGAIRRTDISLVPGDTLVLYSDGVTEAMNPVSEEFGEERLVEVVVRNRDASASGIQAAVVEEVTRFRAGAPPNDDMTIAVVKAVSAA